MDQDSFRKLLETPGAATASRTPASRGSLLAPVVKKPKTASAAGPAFKPRAVKKSAGANGKYRDRAAERRVGEGNDFAEVEAVLEDFERRAAEASDKDAIEAQRRYLGGDGAHSVLVKGLDVALLEQNKAREAQAADDDDTLEEAFLAASEPVVPKKRTREDLIRELKAKREQGDAVNVEPVVGAAKTAEEEARLLEEAKKAGKFRPIGFKPVGASANEKKKVKVKEKDPGRKKKKRKIEVDAKADDRDAEDSTTAAERGQKTEMLPPPLPEKIAAATKAPVAEPEDDPIPEDFDIFADAGEYQGVDLGDDDEEEEEVKAPTDNEPPLDDANSVPKARWFADDETDARTSTSQPTASGLTAALPPPSPPPPEEEEEERPTRLVPLESSVLPSIKDFLAMDKAAGKQGKRKPKRKGKKDGDDDEASKKLSAEDKAERDYKRLKSYTEKKAGASGVK